MNELERKLDDVMRFLRDQRRTRPRGRSPPKREFRQVNAEDRWRGGSRRERGPTYSSPLRRENRDSRSQHREERYSPPSYIGSSHHHGGSSWGSRPPHSSRRSPQSGRRDRDRKMELPVFVGDDAWGWLVKIERYFLVNGIEGDERMEVVLLALEGRALNWFQIWEDQVVFPSWRQFREAVLRRFQPGTVKDPFGPLLRVKQVGSVMEYIEEFEKITGPMRFVDKEIMKGIFVNGLKSELQAEVKSLELETLAEIKDRALMLEQRNTEWKGGGVNPIERGLGYNKSPNLIRSGPGATQVWANKKVGGSGKKLSQVELQE